MSFPQFKDKHRQEALFHPADFLDYKKIKGKFPGKYIIAYQGHALDYFKRKYSGKFEKLFVYKKIPIYVLKSSGIGFFKMPGIGAPEASTFMEEFIAMGGKEFINIGTAGGLQHDGVFLCNRAIRDEGTSHHYISHGKYAYPDKGLTKRFGNFISQQGLEYEPGTTWTIDAPYRETKAEVIEYKKQGVVTVEMEASALFTVAKIRKVKIAAAFVVSDVLGEKWEPKYDKKHYKVNLNKLLDASVECLK